MTPKIQKTESEWKALLAEKGAEPLAYHVTRKEGTERAFTGKYEGNEDPGTYLCICCDKPLFDSATKYESGSGWPSFYAPVTTDAVTMVEDTTHGMTRIEVLCARCDGHLGHVFPDGPQPTGLRFCMNSVSLDFDGGHDH